MANVLDKPLIEELCDEIIRARTEKLQAKIEERTPQKRDHLYLSDIHACTRFLYYSLAEGEKRASINPYLQALFDAGSIWEDKISAELADIGFRVVEKDIRIVIRNPGGHVIATGKIDGKIEYKGQRFPMEAKSMNENLFARINSIDDLFRFEITEKYLRQLLMYLYGEAQESGLFHLNDRSGHWKLIPVYLGNHLDYVERHLQRMEKAWDAAQHELIPDRIPYNHKLCGNCSFAAICLPTTVIEGGTTLNDPEVEAMLVQHEELKPLAAKYDEVHENVKELFQGKPEVTVGGRFLVKPSKRQRDTVDWKSAAITEIPKEKLAAYKKSSESWTVEVTDLSKPA